MNDQLLLFVLCIINIPCRFSLGYISDLYLLSPLYAQSDHKIRIPWYTSGFE